MLKKEIIWREILFQALEKNTYNFQQKELAEKFGYSLSTVFNALKTPRDINAVEVSGKGFRLVNPEKLLLLWATRKNMSKEIIYRTYVGETPAKIESYMPPDVVWAAFSAYKFRFNETPSDYGQVYVYAENPEEIKKRFPPKKGPENLLVLKPDPLYKSYGASGTIAQTFVDIWNTNEWYSKEFLEKLKQKLNF